MDFNPKDIQTFTLPDFTVEADARRATQSEEDGEDDYEAETSEDEEEDGETSSANKQLAFKPANFEGQTTDQDETAFHTSDMARSEEDRIIEKSHTFRSTEFTAEESLLTNAEEFAETVREGARLYSQRMKSEADDRYAEAEAKFAEAEAQLREAEAEKKRIVSEAQGEADSVRKAAYDDGFKAGQEAGAQQRYNEMAPNVQQLESLLEQLSRLRQVVRFQGEQELVQMAVLVAQKVVHEELMINQDVLYNILRSSLRDIETLGKIRVSVHEGDYDFMVKSQSRLEPYLKEEQTLVVQTSIDAEPGSLLIETDETVVNFHFQSQFEHLEEVLSRRLSERQARLHEVDIDSYNFHTPASTAPPSSHDVQT